jgi:hypothetical protein
MTWVWNKYIWMIFVIIVLTGVSVAIDTPVSEGKTLSPGDVIIYRGELYYIEAYYEYIGFWYSPPGGNYIPMFHVLREHGR